MIVSRAPYFFAGAGLCIFVAGPFMITIGWEEIITSMPNYPRLANFLVLESGFACCSLMAIGEWFDRRRFARLAKEAELSPKEPANG